MHPTPGKGLRREFISVGLILGVPSRPQASHKEEETNLITICAGRAMAGRWPGDGRVAKFIPEQNDLMPPRSNGRNSQPQTLMTKMTKSRHSPNVSFIILTDSYSAIRILPRDVVTKNNCPTGRDPATSTLAPDSRHSTALGLYAERVGFRK